MHTRNLSLTFLFAATAATPAAAQRLAVYDPLATGGIGYIETTPPNPLFPLGSPVILAYPEAPVLPPPPPFMVPPGDATFDGVTGLHWRTNGIVLSSMPT